MPEAAIRAYNEAEALYKESEYEKAIVLYEAFLQQNSGSARAQNAHYRLGQCRYKLGDMDSADRHFRRAVDLGPSKVERYAHYYLGQILQERGAWGDAAAQFAKAYDPTGDPDFARHIPPLAAEAYDKARRPLDAAEWYLRHLQNSQAYDESAEHRARLEKIIGEELGVMELRKVLDLKPVFPFDVLTVLALAKALQRDAAYLEARGLLEPVAERQDEYGERARRLLAELGRIFAAGKWKIGCLLPLSGKASVFGVRSRRGVEAAVEALAAQDLGVAVDCRDTQGDPETTARLLEAMAKDEKTLAVLGPLMSKDAARVCPMADDLKIPLLTLATREGLAGLGEYVFRNGLTASMQVRSLVTYAMSQLGLTRFAALYPLKPYGTEMESLFNMEVTNRGGRIVTEIAYEPGATDFGTPIKALKNVLEAFKGADGQPAEQVGVFIPDYFDTVGLLIPQIAFYEVEGVRLLGTSGWNSPQLVEIAGKQAEGAVFVDAFYADPDSPKVQSLSKSFVEKYGEPPGDLEIEAYDSFTLLVSVIAGLKSPSREGVREALLAVRDFPGVAGPLTILANGETQKTLHILTVRRARITRLN